MLEHLRIAQHDILEFLVAANYRPLAWPDDYWPPTAEPPNREAWTNSIQTFKDDLASIRQLAADPRHDLYKPLPHGEGQTLLREILLVIDHNSHHLGQLLFLKKMLL